MQKIVLLSDTHGFLGEDVLEHLSDCDQIWHAGDWGPKCNDILENNFNAPIVGVFGNIDDHILRRIYPETQFFQVEDHRVLMTHIGGYPGRYPARIKAMLDKYQPTVFICGHSHILKVIYDQKHQLLHLNPGACGKQGLHQVRTILKFEIDKSEISNMRIVEFPRW